MLPLLALHYRNDYEQNEHRHSDGCGFYLVSFDGCASGGGNSEYSMESTWMSGYHYSWNCGYYGYNSTGCTESYSMCGCNDYYKAGYAYEADWSWHKDGGVSFSLANDVAVQYSCTETYGYYSCNGDPYSITGAGCDFFSDYGFDWWYGSPYVNYDINDEETLDYTIDLLNYWYYVSIPTSAPDARFTPFYGIQGFRRKVLRRFSD